MRAPEREDAELNELKWWSKWGNLRRRGDGYLLTSEKLREPFFNRAGSLTCDGVPGAAAWAERDLAPLGLSSTVVVFDACGAPKDLLASGYTETDTMTVLFSEGPVTKEGDQGAEVGTANDAGSWGSTYLRSFYGDEGLAGVLGPIVASLQRDRDVTLLESRVKGETAGVLAIYRTPGMAGVYCVGTVPEQRKRGVATGLLAEAREIASREERALVLQTLKSDGALALYLNRGFVPMYSKRVLEKKLR